MRRVASMPSTLGHADVHEHDVRAQLGGERHRLRAVAGLAHDLDARLLAQDHAKAGAHQRLVVGKQDADHRSAA